MIKLSNKNFNGTITRLAKLELEKLLS